jgi:PAS domain S-box-containing protein
MNAVNPYMRRLKWAVLVAAILLLAAIEAQSWLMGGAPLTQVLIAWLLASALAFALVEISARIVNRTQRRLEHEIVERTRVERELRENQERWQQMAENVREVFWLRDQDRFLYVSPAYREIWGLSPESLYADPSAHLAALHPDDRQRIGATHDPDKFLTDHVFAEEFRVVRPDGSVRWIRTQSFPVYDAQGGVIRRAGISEDVTDQVRAEQALRQRNRELALLNQVSQAFAASLDLDRVLASVLEETRDLMNANACSIWLLDPHTGELVCQQATGPQSQLVRGWRLAPGEGLAGWVARRGKSLIVPDAQTDERHFPDVDRVTGVNLHSILTVPLRANPDVVGVIQVLDTRIDYFDPSDQALLEPVAAAAAIAIDKARLYQETDLLRTFNENIVQSMEEGILLEDAAGKIVFINPRAEELTGYSQHELVGQHWRILVPPERVTQIEIESRKRPLGQGSRYETAILSRDERRVPVLVSATPLFVDERFDGVLSVFTDISDRVRAERELRASEAQFRDLVENISEVIYTIDHRGTVTYASPVTESFLGYTPAEITGRPFTDVIHPEDRPRAEQSFRLTFSGHTAPNQYRFLTKSGEVRWARASTRPVLQDGRVAGLRGVLVDVTERVHAEQKRRELEEQLERARRIESLGTLAGGVAHDLNNILGPMVAYPDLILEELPGSSPLRDDVQQIQRSAERAAAVVQDLLTLARRGVYRMLPLDLNTIVAEYVGSPSFSDLIARHSNVTLDLALAPDILPVSGSSPHLLKVLMNLVTNACEAMPYGGTLRISTTCESLDRPLSGYEYVEVGDYVVLRVSDTGVGIEPKDLPRIFEPFYTKKEMGRSGTGLGLAVVYGVTQDHKGKIDIQTSLGEGTTFSLYLPVCRQAIPDVSPESSDYGGSESVLVVDDLEEQRQLAVRLLSSLGYQVHAVNSGRAAVAYLRSHSANILVLDMIMEEDFDGLDTYRKIAHLHPGQKAVIASGYSKTDRVQEAQSLGAGAFVRKPYTLQRLGAAVRQELDRSSPAGD